jgi:hypothetical protein
MFLEKLFGNTFGLIWLIVFLVVVLGLIVFLFIKKEKDIENEKIHICCCRVVNGVSELRRQ